MNVYIYIYIYIYIYYIYSIAQQTSHLKWLNLLIIIATSVVHYTLERIFTHAYLPLSYSARLIAGKKQACYYIDRCLTIYMTFLRISL